MFDNITKLTGDFIKNETTLNLGMSPKGVEIKFREYYFNACNAIAELHYLKPTREQIEELLSFGEFEHVDSCGVKIVVSCPVSGEAERKYYFKMAQARQLHYDMLSGRGAMLRGEDDKYNLCPDAVDYIKRLGLYQRTLMCE